MTTETQTATATATPAPQGADQAATTQGAPQGGAATKADDLDSLLKEFETPATPTDGNGSDKPADGKGEKLTPDRLAKVVDFVETQANRTAAAEVKADIDSAVATVKKNDGLKHLPDELVREMLEGSAAADSRLRNAWLQRHQNPGAWTKVLEGWATKKADAFKQLADPKLTADREAVTAAVRGQGATQTQQLDKSPQEVHAMSDQEFRAWKASKLG